MMHLVVSLLLTARFIAGAAIAGDNPSSPDIPQHQHQQYPQQSVLPSTVDNPQFQQPLLQERTSSDHQDETDTAATFTANAGGYYQQYPTPHILPQKPTSGGLQEARSPNLYQQQHHQQQQHQQQQQSYSPNIYQTHPQYRQPDYDYTQVQKNEDSILERVANGVSDYTSSFSFSVDLAILGVALGALVFAATYTGLIDVDTIKPYFESMLGTANGMRGFGGPTFNSQIDDLNLVVGKALDSVEKWNNLL